VNPIVLPLAVTFAVQVLVSGSSLTAPLLATLIGADLGVPAASVGYYVSVLYATAAISGVASGGIIARWGAHRTLQFGLASGAASTICLAMGYLPTSLLAAVFGGLSLGPTTPASSAVLARATSAANRNIVFSVKQTGVPLGFMLAAIVLPNLALGAGWRTTCLCVAAVLGLAAALLTPLGRHLDTGGGQSVRFSPRAQFAEPLVRVWRQIEMRNISFASFAYSGLQGSLASFMVVFLLHETALDLVAAAAVLACAQAAGAGGRIAWGFVADRSGRPDIVLAALGVAMAGFALAVALGAASMPHAVLVAAAILFGGTAMAWNGVFLGEVARLAAPGRTGEATGATGLFTFGGVAIVPGLFTTIVLLTESYVAAYLVAATLPAGVGMALLRAARAAGISRS